jgi:very-short-patch-repair endonuclease
MRRLAPILAGNGGWIHYRAILDRGWTGREILRARTLEGIDLLRRQWLIFPDADQALRAAARRGGWMTSVSALAHYGLWVPPTVEADPLLHVAVAPDANVPIDRRVRLYRIRPVVERSPRSRIDPLPNVLGNLAKRLAYIDAFAVWESSIAHNHITAEELRRMPWTTTTGALLSKEVSALSDSGVESMFAVRCRRAGIRFVQQVPLAGRPVDALIGKRLVIQIDGYAFHKDARQRRSDVEHDRKLTLMGYTVFRFTYQDVVYDWPRVERQIRAAIAQGLTG